jgi:hypothetical protein
MTVSSRGIDRILADHQVSARYHTDVAATREQTYAALLSCNFSDSFIVRALMKLRGYRSQIDRISGEQSLFDNLKRTGFIQLLVVPGEEIVYGLIGQFWRPTGGLCANLTAEEFHDFHREGFAKAVWNFELTELSPVSTRIATETRVQLFGSSTKWKFRLYWFFVGPFSGMIRIAMLRQVKRKAETLSAIPA